MKITNIILALCVLEVNGFVLQVPKSSALKPLKSSYLRNLDGDSRSDRGSFGVQELPVNGGVSSRSPSPSMYYANLSNAAAAAARGYNQTMPNMPVDSRAIKNFLDMNNPVLVQGGSLRTLSIADPYVERVQVLMSTEGRPLNANVELWHGPDNTPQRMRVYVEDGSLRRFCAVIETPRGQNTVAIRNTGHLEFPLAACVNTGVADGSNNGAGALRAITQTLPGVNRPKIIQGGAVHTYPFPPSVTSVRVMLRTDGRPLNARIELMQGPNNNKQVMEVYTEDGRERPLFAVIETPGVGNVVRIVNTATVEFPITGTVEAFQVDMTGSNSGMGWDSNVDDSFIMGRSW